MQPHKLFQQYLWLVNTIRRSGGITLDDLNQRWVQTALSEGNALSRSTFVRHKEAIQDMFGIFIECDVHNDYKYSIVNDHELRNDSIQNWMLSTLGVSTLLSESVGVHDRILLESVPSNGEHLQEFINAMKANVRVRVMYKKYGSEEITTKVVEPYCVKLFKRRWYALVKNLYRGTFYVMAFDRVVSMELTDHSFVLDPDFDASSYFDDIVGIFKDPETPPTRVVFRAFNQEVFYQRDLPFHHSQQEVATADGYSDFALWVRPTKEFLTPLLSRGPFIQVLEPQSLVEEIKEQIERMRNLYE